MTTVGGIEITTTTAIPKRFSMLLWGPAKVGKTTLAASAPGKKLWINFDPDGTASLLGRPDCQVVDLSTEKPYVLMPKLLDIENNPLQLRQMLATGGSLADIETIVIDSATMLANMAHAHACTVKKLNYEEPGQRGYSVKNNYISQILRAFLTVAQETGKNIIIIAHEGGPDRDDKGNLIGYSLSLSESLTVGLTALPSEVWAVRDDGSKRWIAVRPCRQRSPMGSRMFISDPNKPEFLWQYNADTGAGEGIATWFKRWQDAGKKIPVPS